MKQPKNTRTAVIIGAGPAGLTAAYELLIRTNIKPVILERDLRVGGLATTINYKGYRLDIGGHRFFTKSDRVMAWWLKQLPLEYAKEATSINYHGRRKVIKNILYDFAPDTYEDVMLVRERKSRIFYRGSFYDYPLKFNVTTLKQLGVITSIQMLASYIYSAIVPKKPEKNLEDFFINRFGEKLYQIFFKTYTEKVWGMQCKNISAQWGMQRIKGLSIAKALRASILGNSEETSLIERFLYPKYGPGQLWDKVAKDIVSKGGEILYQTSIDQIYVKNNKVQTVFFINKDGQRRKMKANYVFSTTDIRELVSRLDLDIPAEIREIANGLKYRDFIVVGLLFNKMVMKNGQKIDDNWIYVHDKSVHVGRIQIFNNWSPYLIKDQSKSWVGMEYFCGLGDWLWNKTDTQLIDLAKKELRKMGLISLNDYLDGIVVRVPKAYPAYTGTYKDFPKLRKYLDRIENLYLIGRNGMHKYNNQDHSMLTAMVAIDNIFKGKKNKSNIWAVNTEEEYHETK